MNYSLAEIPSGVAGTDRTVREIMRLVDYDLKRPQIRLLATRHLQSYGIPSKDKIGEARAIYQMVRRNIRYQKDPIGIETVQSPTTTWQIRAGDCDDHVGLVAALAMSIGIPVRLRVIGFNQDNLIHIFPELLVDNKWIPADTTEPERGFGWRPKKFPIEKIYNFKGEVVNMGEIKKGALQTGIYNAVMNTLNNNWANGLINKKDVEGYVSVIDGGNFPSKKALYVEPTRKAIVDFLNYVNSKNIGSLKPGGLSGMEGLGGFLSSVWGAVKSVVGGVVKTVTGSGGGETQVVVQQAPAPVSTGFFDQPYAMPLMIGGGGLLLYLLLKR